MLIDGVFSGGGLKAFTLVGAYQMLEEKGFRFKRVAGTSAGAILACLIAAGYTGKEIEEVLDNQDFQTLLDPRKTILPSPFMKWLLLYWRLGLYQGIALENFFMETLAAKGVYTFGDLPPGTLKLVTSDLTNGKMMVFPDDLPHYGIPAASFPITRALRMSCGLPFYIRTCKIDCWRWQATGKRERPILGLKISRAQEEWSGYKITNGLNLFEALFSTMQTAHDERYISRKHEKNIIFIPVDEKLTTKFDMSQEMKERLIEMEKVARINF